MATLNQPPIHPFPQVCFTCHKPIARHWFEFIRRRLEATDQQNSDLPLRIINETELLGKGEATLEKKILDDLGVVRYCCRRMILAQPTVEVPPPPKGTPLPAPTPFPEEST